MCKVCKFMPSFAILLFVGLLVLTAATLVRAEGAVPMPTCTISITEAAVQGEQLRNQGIDVQVSHMRGTEVQIFNEVIKDVTQGQGELNGSTIELEIYTVTDKAKGQAVVFVWEVDKDRCALNVENMPLATFNDVLVPALIEKIEAKAKGKI